MITNKDVLRVKNRSLLIMIASAVFFIIAGVLGVAYGKEN